MLLEQVEIKFLLKNILQKCIIDVLFITLIRWNISFQDLMRFFEANRNRQTARLNAVAGAPTAGRAASATAAAAAAAPPIPPNIVAFFQVGQVK